jgi:hypothetical protein
VSVSKELSDLAAEYEAAKVAYEDAERVEFIARSERCTAANRLTVAQKMCGLPGACTVTSNHLLALLRGERLDGSNPEDVKRQAAAEIERLRDLPAIVLALVIGNLIGYWLEHR